VDLLAELDAYTAHDDAEAADLARVRTLATSGDPWSRSRPVHVTGSALVLHPPTGRVLLRWHERMGGWLHVGGHVDPGDAGPFAAAVREGREETGLADLVPWPDADRPRPVHVVVVPVPAGRGEPAHEHADVRYLLATARPDAVVPESPAARLRWLTPAAAIQAVGHDNLRVTLARAAALLSNGTPSGPASPPSTSTSGRG
jgi:8-oxo-dGTP pyrophosphatase MutT (NUDIX family)